MTKRISQCSSWSSQRKRRKSKKAIEEKLGQEQVNIATSSGGSIPRRIPVTIDTSTSRGGGSTTSTVNKEEMTQIFAQFEKNFQPGTYTKINPAGMKLKEIKKIEANYIPNDLGRGRRSKRRYPESTRYCPLHGYNIKPDHTPVSCTNREKNHNEAATITHRIGGCLTNCPFYTKWWCRK